MKHALNTRLSASMASAVPSSQACALFSRIDGKYSTGAWFLVEAEARAYADAWFTKYQESCIRLGMPVDVTVTLKVFPASVGTPETS